MARGGEGEGRAAAGRAGAANLGERERARGDGVSAERYSSPLQRVEDTHVCRAGSAGRGTAFAFSTGRHTPAPASDPRRSLGSE